VFFSEKETILGLTMLTFDASHCRGYNSLGSAAIVMFLMFNGIFTRESSYYFQRVLAIAILSVCLSVCHTGGSVKTGAS